jgi:hypothetical protein
MAMGAATMVEAAIIVGTEAFTAAIEVSTAAVSTAAVPTAATGAARTVVGRIEGVPRFEGELAAVDERGDVAAAGDPISGSSMMSRCSAICRTEFRSIALHITAAMSCTSASSDVEKIDPLAVTTGRDGYLRVHYERLGVKFQTYDQWLALGGFLPPTR